MNTYPASLPPGIGGTPVNLLTRELLRRGQRVVLFTLDPTLHSEAVFRGPLLTICVGPWRTDHPARDLFAAERHWLLQAVRRVQTGFVHTHCTQEYGASMLGAFLQLAKRHHRGRRAAQLAAPQPDSAYTDALH